ncbi:ATP-binding protein [Phenylobacterium sp.]|uniref:ATP-binding protein n=1 Tax=Phenylobacterium sp. TaxID=1871053 RepID=UPI0027318DB0|nr:ATP-binding protein [Phenylobacterium sp.]MDP1617447.1 ATP-binding protein [Phenylobacterium sp.]MDP1988784.1 ATP-binding protein [Phenylobacterium sp.]
MMLDLDKEQLREALASAKQIEASLRERLREQDLVLSGLEALQGEEDPAVLQARVFDLLSRSVAFNLALVLEPEGEGFVCTAATDQAAVGARWPGGGFFSRVAHGRAAVTPDNRRVPEWGQCDGLSPLPGAGIYAPILAASGPGLLVLCSHQPGAYSARDGALVSRLSLLVSQTLAAAQRRRLSDAARSADIARKAAVEASEAKSRFLANMSHEIRTPLNGVTAVADLLAMTELAPRQQEMAQLIAQSGRMLERLLNDVLDFAKIEAGQLDIEREPFDLGPALHAMIDLFAAKADAKGLGFRAHIDPNAAGVFEGDSLRVRQILGNLLSNAVKFTEAGEVALHVSAEDGPEDALITLRVTDTGCGFTPERGARLFDRFEQGDDSITRQFGGTGLGLAISRSLAEMMDGAITWRSTPGQGSTFEATFRARRAPDAGRAGPEPAAPRHDPDLKVLVVEDNPNNRRIVAMILELVQAQATYAENGQEGLDAFAPGRFDIVLMDLQMPVLDGLSAIRRIRALERVAAAPPVPIIALSANAMTHHVAESLAAGATAHVAKPILPARLIQTMVGLVQDGAGHRPAQAAG